MIASNAIALIAVSYAATLFFTIRLEDNSQLLNVPFLFTAACLVVIVVVPTAVYLLMKAKEEWILN